MENKEGLLRRKAAEMLSKSIGKDIFYTNGLLTNMDKLAKERNIPDVAITTQE